MERLPIELLSIILGLVAHGCIASAAACVCVSREWRRAAGMVLTPGASTLGRVCFAYGRCYEFLSNLWGRTPCRRHSCLWRVILDARDVRNTMRGFDSVGVGSANFLMMDTLRWHNGPADPTVFVEFAGFSFRAASECWPGRERRDHPYATLGRHYERQGDAKLHIFDVLIAWRKMDERRRRKVVPSCGDACYLEWALSQRRHQ